MEPSIVIALAVTETVAQLLQAGDVTPCQAFQGSAPITIGRTFHSATRTLPIEQLSVRFIPISRVLSPPSSPVLPSVSESSSSETILVRDADDARKLFSDDHNPTPWFTSFLADLDDALLFNPIEFTHEPLCCVCLASEDDPDPIGAFVEQRDSLAAARTIFADLSSEISIPVKFVLLSDKDRNGAKSRPIFEAMQTTFHPSVVSVLNVDFGAKMPSPPITRFVFDLLTLTILPDLEFRIRSLYGSIAAVRKGFRNQLKSLFGGRKPAKAETMVGFNVSAPVEVQVRQLADYAYLIGDLPLALEQYRAMGGDCRGKERLRVELALAETGVALCGAMLSARSLPTLPLRELEASLESAVHGFLSLGRVLCAARVAARAAHLARAVSGLARCAAALLLRVGSKDDTQMAALLLEQSAFAFLCPRPPLVRQYAFHLIRAGHMFQKLALRSHAIRCYSSAFCVYSAKSWAHIEDHIRFKLGRESFNVGEYGTSLAHYASLVGAGRQRQDTFLKEFLIVARRAGVLDQCFNVELPRITVQEVCVGDGATLPQAVADPVWAQPDLYLRHDLRSCWTLCLWPQEIAIGAILTVVCAVRNPLQLPLQMRHFRLHCLVDDTVDGVESSEVEVGLGALETATVTLTAVFRRPGRLRLAGFRWAILDQIQAQAPLTYPPSDVADGKQLGRILRWMQAGAHRSPLSPLPLSPQLQFQVVEYSPPLPHISMRFPSFPSSLYFGEIARLQLLVDVDANSPISAEIDVSNADFLSHSGASRLLLQPGSNPLAFVLRGVVLGAQRIRVLLRYETGTLHRVTFVTHEVAVLAALQVGLAVRLAADQIRDCLLDLAIVNRCADSTIAIDEIRLRNAREGGFSLEDLGFRRRSLEAGEEAELVLGLRPSTDPVSALVFNQLAPPLQEDAEMGREPILEVYWRAVQQDRYGVIRLGVDFSKIADAPSCPLRVAVQFDAVVHHDFSTAMLARIPVKVIIGNGSSEAITFDFECLEPNAVFDAETRQFRAVATACSLGRYFWSGITRRKSLRIDGGGEMTIGLEACFAQAGVFALNRFKFMVQRSAAPPRLFFFPIQRLVQIRNSP